jgi:uncharacterized membrane protein
MNYALERPHGSSGRALAYAVGGGVVALGLVALWRSQQGRAAYYADSAPGRTSRRTYYGEYAVVGRTVTINRPRAELYAYWRDSANLPRFMSNVEKVTVDGDITTWDISAPGGGSVSVRTRIVSDRENEEIAWRSIEGSEIDTEGKVMFRDAPGNRGTEVEAVIAYIPPGGEAGRLIAKLFQREPRLQGRREMKRFKMLMETGEVATSSNRKSA